MPSQSEHAWWHSNEGKDFGVRCPQVHRQQRGQSGYAAPRGHALDGPIVVRPEDDVQLDAAAAHEGLELLDASTFAKGDERNPAKVCERNWSTPSADQKRVVVGNDDDERVIHEFDRLEGAVWQRKNGEANVQLTPLEKSEEQIILCHFRQLNVDLRPLLAESPEDGRQDSSAATLERAHTQRSGLSIAEVREIGMKSLKPGNDHFGMAQKQPAGLGHFDPSLTSGPLDQPRRKHSFQCGDLLTEGRLRASEALRGGPERPLLTDRLQDEQMTQMQISQIIRLHDQLVRLRYLLLYCCTPTLTHQSESTRWGGIMPRMKDVEHRTTPLSNSTPNSVAGWLELDKKYRIRGRYDVSQVQVKGQGVWVWDADGKPYIDFESGQVCASTGHCHPAYTKAIAEQAAKLVQTGSGYTNPPRVLLAKKLAEIMPLGLERSYFACTGSEATEAALRLAKLYTGRTEIVSLMRGYHGMTHASLAVTGLGGKFKSIPGSGLTGVTFIPAPYAYRSPYRETRPGDDMAFFRHGMEIINWTSTGAPAAIILEVIMSVGGMIVPSREYVQAVRHWCDETGALMIIDEAQSGVGRTGKWFAIEHFGVVPDIITTSKSLGGGIPLSGVTTTNKIADRVQELGYHQSSSHTDDPFLCAVGLAHIQILEDEGLVQNAAEQGHYLKTAFEGMMRKHEIVGDVRGIGMMLGLEIVTDKSSKTPSALHASAISQYCRDNGLLLGHRPTGAVSGNIIRILPPLILKREEADQALEILEAAIRHAEKTVSATPQSGTGWMS